MSVTSYFTNLSNVPDRQKNISCDIKQAICPEWSSFCIHHATSSEDSNSSGASSNSSSSRRSDMKTDMMSLKNISSSNFSDKAFLLQTPEKGLNYYVESEKRTTPRKPLKPTKSANKSDPSFRGVTLQMKTSVKRRKDDIETQLVIRSYFTAKKRRAFTENNSCQRPLVNSRLKPSSLELRFQQTSDPKNYDADEMKENCDELGCRPLRLTTPIGVEKECASCGTVKTPLWRDAEDGTPLCNACGIRYKKYRIRCFHCWYIPKKEEKTSSCWRCKGCGDFIRVPVGRRGSMVFGGL